MGIHCSFVSVESCVSERLVSNLEHAPVLVQSWGKNSYPVLSCRNANPVSGDFVSVYQVQQAFKKTLIRSSRNSNCNWYNCPCLREGDSNWWMIILLEIGLIVSFSLLSWNRKERLYYWTSIEVHKQNIVMEDQTVNLLFGGKLCVYVASLGWQHFTGVKAVIWCIVFRQAACSLMQEVAKSNAMEEYLKGLGNCVTTVPFMVMCVKIQTIWSHASGYKITIWWGLWKEFLPCMAVHGWLGPDLLMFLGGSGNLLGSLQYYVW